MIGPVGTQQVVAPSGEARGVGKSAQAVGQQAKAIVAIAREAGAEVPRNARGLAASALARGIDPASLFAARVTEPEGLGDPIEPGDAPVAGAPVAEVSIDGGETGSVITGIEEDAESLPRALEADKQLIVSEGPGRALLLDETTSRDAG